MTTWTHGQCYWLNMAMWPYKDNDVISISALLLHAVWPKPKFTNNEKTKQSLVCRALPEHPEYQTLKQSSSYADPSSITMNWCFGDPSQKHETHAYEPAPDRLPLHRMTPSPAAQCKQAGQWEIWASRVSVRVNRSNMSIKFAICLVNLKQL